MTELETAQEVNVDGKTVVNTIRFCESCNNMLMPDHQESTLVFICTKKGCNFQIKINGTGKFENLVSRKEFLKEKRIIIDPDYALDPTMPRESVNCPLCNYNEAVFLISTDLEDTKIELIYVCGNLKCGNTWKKNVIER